MPLRFARLATGVLPPPLIAAAEVALRNVLHLPATRGLVLSASCYTQGDFLASHRDEDNTGAAFVRARAVIWHLGPRHWQREDGGLLVDEQAGGETCERALVPRFNAVVHFAVPRSHRVTPVVGRRRRLALYGWAIAPRLPVATAESWLAGLDTATREAGAGRDGDGDGEGDASAGVGPRAALVLPVDHSAAYAALRLWAAVAVLPALDVPVEYEDADPVSDDNQADADDSSDTGADRDARTLDRRETERRDEESVCAASLSPRAGLRARLARTILSEILPVSVLPAASQHEHGVVIVAVPNPTTSRLTRARVRHLPLPSLSAIVADESLSAAARTVRSRMLAAAGQLMRAAGFGPPSSSLSPRAALLLLLNDEADQHDDASASATPTS